ncbi:MAG: hypothetical protein OEM52_15135, partial [bacterium]|nr:hypothetical protein [bacterium]
HCVLDIREILNAIGRYQVANVFDPYSLNELTQHGYLDQTLLHNEWNYTTIGGNPITQIQAVSTSQCSFGAGKTIIFDLSHGEFFGWGM